MTLEVQAQQTEPEFYPEEQAPDTTRLPEDRDAEAATIGSVLYDPNCYQDIAFLQAADFTDDRLHWIFMAFQCLYEQGEPLDDQVTLRAELERMGHPVDEFYLLSLMQLVPTSLHAGKYAAIVKDQARRRDLITLAGSMAAAAYNPNKPIDEILTRTVEAAQAGTGSAQRRYIVHNAADALAPRAPVGWIVEGLIYGKSITVMYGDGGTKKTWAGMYLAACVASGAAWGEIETHKTRVLFVDEENGEDEISTRAAFCIRGALADESAELRYISLAAFHLDDPHDEAVLTNEILLQRAGLVILDALADLMIGDENTKQDTQPVFNALRRIAEKTGAAILVIHHANKQGGHRGSSVIKDAPDILLRVESDPESNFINFKTEKNRKGKAIKWAMLATWTEDRFYLSPADTQEKTKALSKSQEYVIRYLTERGESPLPAIVGGADTCSPEAARKAVYNLADLRKIYRTNPGETGQGVTAIYDLVKADESVF